MKKIIRYNPALTTLNMGDNIIVTSINEQMNSLFQDCFMVDVSSHLPVSYVFTKLLKEADFKFVLGSNLLPGRLDSIARQWDINIINAKSLGPAVLIGAGWQKYNSNPTFYTKRTYRKILSQTYLHSVRDEYTKGQLAKCGIHNVLATACPTMWKLTPEFCEGIPSKKARNVITTVTDYKRDLIADRHMLETLLEQYDKVYIWLQGYDDDTYINELNDSSCLIRINPALEDYDAILNTDDVEYVGTRLHAGIRAMQHRKRAIIIGVDNRAQEINKDYNINVLSRSRINELDDYVQQEFPTKVHIPLEAIRKWKSQFLEDED